MTPGRRGHVTGGCRGIAPVLAGMVFWVAQAVAQVQAVPPGLRPNLAPPDALRPPNFIAIPLAPPASAPTAARPAPALPSVAARAPRPVPIAEEASIGLPIRRAVIHHLEGAGVVSALRAAGYLRRLADTIELRAVTDVPALPSIRYFYEEDAGAAGVAAIALEASGRFQVRGFPDYRPRPRPGLIEVWLPPP